MYKDKYPKACCLLRVQPATVKMSDPDIGCDVERVMDSRHPQKAQNLPVKLLAALASLVVPDCVESRDVQYQH